MGTTDSKQRLGEKVIAAKKKLEDKALQSERLKFFESKSPETIKVIIDNIVQAFETCSPFLENTLLIAWQSDAKQCQETILQSSKKVLSEPIIPEEYQWFQKYVLSSSIWFYKTNKNTFMFEELLNIVDNMSQEIITSMNSIYSLFQSHPKWKDLMNIKNETKISRQDNKNVGLLNEKGITDILDLKEETAENMETFIDSNLAVNILTTTAKQINNEFQNHMNNVMRHYGTVKSGPIKKLERCQSKIENDYQNATFPKAAKLLDLVRCSVTFNTLDQLLDGYKALLSHINRNPTMVELSRIKNGFLDPNYNGGYRDIKVNIVYHSQTTLGKKTSMICEVQLLLLNYLHEKKRIHKLYNISRQELFFKMVVTEASNETNNSIKDMNDLQFEEILKVDENVKMDHSNNKLFKCTIDTDLRLLGMENTDSFVCMEIDSKKIVFEQKVSHNRRRRSHNWIVRNNEKHVTVQTSLNTIKMFKVLKMHNQFEFKENNSLEICYDKKDTILFCEFDNNFENIFIVLNDDVFEQRSMNDINNVKVRIKLNDKIKSSSLKQLALSDDGTLSVVGAINANFFYIIDIQKKIQHQLSSTVLTSTRNPCFVNGDTEYIAVAGKKQKIEIWDIRKQIAIRVIDIGKSIFITAMTVTNNILAVGGWDNILRLYDVRNWEMFYSKDVKVGTYSLHLTSDCKYLTIGGDGDGNGRDRKCMVLEVK